VTYWNDHKCPPLVERRRKQERRLHIKLALEEKRHDETRAPGVDRSGPVDSG
jgi:hypothetical protein